jgi:HPt (histidine-containing phosphotransfer) domain-containing protein
MLHEASGNDLPFERALLCAFQETCCPHFESLPGFLQASTICSASLCTYILGEKASDAKNALFSLHAIKGSSMQLGALRVAKAASELEDQLKLEENSVVHAFDQLKTEFTRFVAVFEEYISESMSAPVSSVGALPPPMGHKVKSNELALVAPAAEPDKNRLTKSF